MYLKLRPISNLDATPSFVFVLNQLFCMISNSKVILGLICCDEFPNCESLVLLPQVDVLNLSFDLALEPHESFCFG